MNSICNYRICWKEFQILDEKPLTNKPFEEIVVAWVDQFAVFDNQFKLVKKNKKLY